MTYSKANTLLRIKALSDELGELQTPPDEGGVSYSQNIIYISLVKNTRPYIERLAHQINGTYASGYYDACSVMIRRLLETLIVELFEAKEIAAKIKNNGDDFCYLGDLIKLTLSEPSWNLTRNTKNALGKLKEVGDKSAHSRRFIAQRLDIDNIQSGLRTAVQELIILAEIKDKK